MTPSEPSNHGDGSCALKSIGPVGISAGQSESYTKLLGGLGRAWRGERGGTWLGRKGFIAVYRFGLPHDSAGQG